ncbi:MAG: gamma-glutamylcyclotransferase family protein [Pseudomonadota bacterium]
MKPIFFYGSLRDRDLLQIVLDHEVPAGEFLAAEAPDMHTVQLATEAYPVLVPAPGRVAAGMALISPSAEDIARLEYFEEAEYGLGDLDIRTQDGWISAQFFRGTGKALETDLPWDYTFWRLNERPVALRAAREYMSYYGHLTIEEVDQIWPDIMARARTLRAAG